MTLFLGNIWDELLSDRGLRFLEEHYGRVSGNWLREPRRAPRPASGDILVLAPSTLDSALTTEHTDTGPSDTIAWILFPDQVLGWDFHRNTYRYQVVPSVSAVVDEATTLLANSEYTASALRRAGVTRSAAVVTPAVDCGGIAAYADPVRAAGDQDEVHVLWAHMWRTQKDPELALSIVDTILNRCPWVRASVGRAFSWADAQHSPAAFRDSVNARLMGIRARHGDRFALLPRFDQPPDYWRFLGGVDISFSCAREESFGVAMLEHAAAGVACVVPRALAYPESHPDTALTDPAATAITGRVCSLVEDPSRRRKAATDGRARAGRFDARAVTAALCAEIDSVVRA